MHDLFAGVDEILHGGDVGDPDILIELGAIAPVHAVRGNCDHGELGQLPEFVVRRYEGHTLLMTHILEQPARVRALVRARLEEAGASIVVYGHTHRYGDQTRDGVRFINPGSAGAPRYGLPATVALLELGDQARCRVRTLDGEEVQLP